MTPAFPTHLPQTSKRIGADKAKKARKAYVSSAAVPPTPATTDRVEVFDERRPQQPYSRYGHFALRRHRKAA